MNLVIYQSCCSQRQGRQLDCSGKTSWIRYVVCITHLFAGTFTKTIYEMASCIITIKTEVITEVYDAAGRFDVMSVDKLS